MQLVHTAGQKAGEGDMYFGILRPLTISSADRDVSIGSRTQRKILAALLAGAGTIVTTDRLINVLWGDRPPATAVQSLYTYISRLRRALHEPRDDVLATRPPGYVLQIGPEHTDAGRFERLLADARNLAVERPEKAHALLDDALALWRGPAYAEFADDDFVRSEATRLNELRLAAIEDRFDAALAVGRHAELTGEIGAYAAEHPLRERPRAQLMLALYRSGRQVEALEVMRAFRQQLDEDLGMDPSAELRDLETAILRQDTRLAWAALRSTATLDLTSSGDADVVGRVHAPSYGGHRLPAEVSSLVGRGDDVAAVTDALSERRVVTLTGVGGVGKTRLAIHVARSVIGRFPDGAWYCELEPVADAAAVGHAVAAAVGARQQPERTLEQSLLMYLASKKLLLVVDNCEHVLADAARLIEAVARKCPHVTVLATSRIGLGVAGEHIRPTAPLPTPDPGSGADTTAFPAVRLFAERARAVRPDLELTDQNLEHIADVCRRLDGLPLAIELAAARMRALNPVDLAARIGDRFGVLTTAKPTVAARHRTLRAVVDWSYSLLSPDEQRLFCELSVFAGGFTLSAAEAVCAGESVADLLGALVDNSLVTAGSTAGQVRYSMLETMRAYGRDLLEHRGERSQVRRAHAIYYADLAKRAERELRGPGEGRWTAVLNADQDNIRAAHAWAVEERDTDLALRISAGLYHYALYQLHDEAVGWAQAALGLPGADAHDLYTTVCGSVGEGLTLRGELKRAHALADRALSRVTDLEDRRRLPALKVMTAVALYEGRLDDCVAWAGEQLVLARRDDDLWYVAEALLFQGLARTYAGDPEEGRAKAKENLEVARALGNPSMIAWALYSQAEGLSHTDRDQAERYYADAIALADSVGSAFAANIAEVGLAALLARSGEHCGALRAFRRSIDQWHRMQVWHHQWTTLRNLVPLLVRLREHEPAAMLLGAMGGADTEAYGADAETMAGAANALSDALGLRAFTDATTRGAEMTADAAIKFALATIDGAMARCQG